MFDDLAGPTIELGVVEGEPHLGRVCLGVRGSDQEQVGGLVALWRKRDPGLITASQAHRNEDQEEG